MRKTLLSLLLLTTSSAIAAPFVYPAAWFAENPAQIKTGGDVKDYAIYDFKTFNPFISAESGSVPYRMGMNAGLFIQSPIDDSYMPLMAAAMPKVSNDGKRFVVTLRPGMKFSDGKPITAKDFVTTAKIHSDKGVGSNFFDNFYQGEQAISVKALNSSTLQIDFPRVSAGAYSRMSFTPWPDHIFGPVYAKGGAEAIKQMWGLNTKPSSLVTAGAWTLSAYNPGQLAVFKKNPYFGQWNVDARNRPLPYLDSYSVRVMADGNAAIAAFLAGQIDFFMPRNTDDLAQVKRAIDSKKLSATLLANVSPSTQSSWITFNWNKASDPDKQKLFRDVRFRRAMSHLANRAAMVQLGMGGMGSEVYTSVYPMFKNYQFASTPTYKYNTAEALRLLGQLGYTTKNAQGWLVNAAGQPLEFDLTTDTGNTLHEQIGQIFTDEAKKVGVKINYRPIDFNSLVTQLLDRSDDRKFDAILLNIGGGDNFWPYLRNQVPCGATLHAWNRTPDNSCLTEQEKQIEKLYDQGDQTLDAAARRKLGEQLSKIESEQQAMIYLVGPNFHTAYNNRVGGMYKKDLINSQNYEAPWSHITKYLK